MFGKGERAEKVFSWVIGIAIVATILMITYLFAAVIFNWTPFNRVKTVDVNVNNQGFTSASHDMMSESALKRSYQLHDQLITKLKIAEGEVNIQSFQGPPVEAIDTMKQYLNNVQGLYYNPNTYAAIKKAVNYLITNQCNITQGYTAEMADYVILDAISRLQQDLNKLQSMISMITPDGKPLLSTTEQHSLLENSLSGYLATDGAGMDPQIKRALGDVLQFTNVDLDKSSANYTDNAYGYALNPESVSKHFDQVNERKNSLAKYAPAPKSTYIIEESMRNTDWVGPLRSWRQCLGGMGPFTTQDAPNLSMLKNNVLNPTNGIASSFCGTGGGGGGPIMTCGI